MAKRRPSVRRVKRLRSYDVAEAARAVGVTPATVRGWRKSGLKPVEGMRPAIFRGVDLIAFLQSREAARKTCAPACPKPQLIGGGRGPGVARLMAEAEAQLRLARPQVPPPRAPDP